MTKCNRECDIYSRVVGYYRPVVAWNRGKQEEYGERVTFLVPSDDAPAPPTQDLKPNWEWSVELMTRVMDRIYKTATDRVHHQLEIGCIQLDDLFAEYKPRVTESVRLALSVDLIRGGFHVGWINDILYFSQGEFDPSDAHGNTYLVPPSDRVRCIIDAFIARFNDPNDDDRALMLIQLYAANVLDDVNKRDLEVAVVHLQYQYGITVQIEGLSLRLPLPGHKEFNDGANKEDYGIDNV